jgi:hypothetical protein
MKRLLVATFTLFALFAATAAQAAQFASPEGVWELEFRDSHFRVVYCGDGTALCGTLIWLSKNSSQPEKVKYLNKMVVKYVKPIAPNKWKGEMDLLGEHVTGTVEQLSDDQLALTGCKYLFFCKTYMMYRLAPGVSPADQANKPATAKKTNKKANKSS